MRWSQPGATAPDVDAARWIKRDGVERRRATTILRIRGENASQPAAEALVEAAVGGQPGHKRVQYLLGTRTLRAGQHDLAVGLHDDALGHRILAQVDDVEAPRPDTGVRTAVGEQAHHCDAQERVAAGHLTGGDDRAARTQRERVGTSPRGSTHHPAEAEAGIEAAVGVEPLDHHAAAVVPGHDDLAVGLDQDRAAYSGTGLERAFQSAAGAEARHQQRRSRVAGGDHLAVGLDRHTVQLGTGG